MSKFDISIDRRHQNSYKWDVGEKELPMWVADMDFKTAEPVMEALKNRLDQGVFGYMVVPKEWNEAISYWWNKRHHFQIESDWLMFCTGVVPAISSIVRKMTTVGENILIQTPVYNIFYNSILNNGRHVLESPLVYENGEYHIDYKDLEEKLSDPQTTMMILCNPHNPIGKIWDKETLRRIGSLCYKYHVLVVSDEIHCDITDPNKEYIPFASVSEECLNNSIVCIAPTKAFNLAGLQTAAIYVKNPVLRQKVNRGINTDEVAEPNAFAVDAAIAAFTKGEPWLMELCAYIYANKEIARNYFKDEIPDLYLVPSEATYLLWIDCHKIVSDASILTEYLREKTGLYVSSGKQYGEAGKSFIRMNIATSKERLMDGLQRFKRGVIQFKKENEINE